MLLSFGVYVKILLECSIKGTTQQQMIADIVGTIDPENKYKNSDHKHAASKLATCKTNFPSSGELTNVVDLAKATGTAKLKDKFSEVTKHIVEDQKQLVVKALQYIIGSEETRDYISNNKAQLFKKYMGTTAENISKAENVDLQAFLAGIFLFIVLTNDTNTLHPEDLKKINGDFLKDPKKGDSSGNSTGSSNENDTKISGNISGTPNITSSPTAPEDIKTPINSTNNRSGTVYHFGDPFDDNASEDLNVSNGRVIRLNPDHSRYLLSDCKDEDCLEFYPSNLYIISLYFITLKYENEYYLLLNYGSYLRHDESWADSHIWSVPYTNTRIDLRDRKVCKVKEIRSVYDEALKQTKEEAHNSGHVSMQETLSILEEDMFYQLGIVYKKLRHGEDYIEYKISASEPDKRRCYYIREFFVSDVDDTGIINLADPRCLHGHYYLPFSLADNLPPISIKTHGVKGTQGAYQFMGKAIPENITDAFIYKKKLLTKIAVNVNKSAMIHKEAGVIFRIAVTNSSGIFNAALDKGLFDQQVSSALEECMLYNNVRHYMLDIYQVTGVMPDVGVETVTDFKNILEDLYSRLEKICGPRAFERFPAYLAPEKKLLLRCTALACEYEYGKIINITSQRPGFAGEAFGKLRRMAHETHHVQLNMKETINGILFGMDVKDDGVIAFSSWGVKKDYAVKYYADGAIMQFMLLDRGH